MSCSRSIGKEDTLSKVCGHYYGNMVGAVNLYTNSPSWSEYKTESILEVKITKSCVILEITTQLKIREISGKEINH